MGYTKPNTTVLVLAHSSSAPLDSTTYYWGSLTALTGSATGPRITSSIKGVITGMALHIWNSTIDASAENDTISLRINDATDYQIYLGTVVSGDYTNMALNIPVNVGDVIVVKEVTPAWATNPTGVYKTITLVIDL